MCLLSDTDFEHTRGDHDVNTDVLLYLPVLHVVFDGDKQHPLAGTAVPASNGFLASDTASRLGQSG